MLVSSRIKEMPDQVRRTFEQMLFESRAKVDGLFAKILVLQWFCGIACAFWISPRSWVGVSSQVHFHVWTAIVLGGLICGLPFWMALIAPGKLVTRLTFRLDS